MRGRIQLASLVSGIVVPPQPDPGVPQARCSITDCPATPSLTLAHSLTALCSGSIAFTAQPSALAALGGIGAVRLGHTLAAVAVLRSLASASTAHRHRQSTKSSLESTQGLILKIISAASVRNFKKRGRPKCVAETESAFRFIVTHWRFYRPISRLRPAYSAQMKSRFRKRFLGRLGAASAETRG